MSGTYISPALRREVIERAGQCCEYCRVAQADIFFAFEIDHIIAEKHGGPTTADNLCLACPECNAFKGSDIASIDWGHGDGLAPLYHPRRQRWSDHFRYDADTSHIEPLTPEGRVTVFILRLNDPDRMGDRILLHEAGRYPCR